MKRLFNILWSKKKRENKTQEKSEREREREGGEAMKYLLYGAERMEKLKGCYKGVLQHMLTSAHHFPTDYII